MVTVQRISSSSPVWVNRWTVTSLSSGKEYTVGQKSDGSYGCDCPAWKFAKAPKPHCKHILGLIANEPVDQKRTAEWRKNAGNRTATAVVQHREQSVVSSRIKPTPPPPEPVFLLQTRRQITLD